MILSLQKRHRWIWGFLAILLPLIFFLSLPEIVNKMETSISNDQFDLVHDQKLGINLASSKIGTVLRVQVLKPLVQPSPVLYYGEDFVGKLGPVGAYVFHLPADVRPLVLRDAIKNGIQETIKLQ